MSGMEKLALPAKVTYSPLVIPPRCRKPRPVPDTFDHVLEVPAYTGDEAPLASRVNLYEEVVELRAVGGKFYRHAPERSLPDVLEVRAWGHRRADAIRDAEKEVEGLVLIDGQVWREASEPVYEVQTFGRGWNHGGTSLQPFIPWEGSDLNQPGYYSALDREAAITAGVKRAEDRGDTDSVERIRAARTIEVLDPSAFSLEPMGVRQEKAAAIVRKLVAGAAKAVQEADPAGLDDALLELEKAVKAARKAVRSAGV